MSSERIERYLKLTENALAKVEILFPEDSEKNEMANRILEMVRSYHSDAIFFLKEGRGDDAFAAINYAHGWLDAGVRLELLDGKGDWKLFTLP
ncbi:MAG: hypothetical protein BEU04_00390 [Marine Group III euryarchaeote CG-Bathy1]|uniref:DUF357 domain-containing protein n=1 Tax=Marine Group III euryarchaeote CG-Bathy1 TaxID=1889001 RepID=A0A1J5U302_9ARCH|nr:MAG: hypothetical protein BEU04_00390 [Marine Group III euryarchaeote CG-Bathy1]